MKKSICFITLLFLYGCSEEPIGEHGFTATDIEEGWFSVKFQYVDSSTKIIGTFHGLNACNAYGEGYMSAQRKSITTDVEVKDYVCCYERKDPECKYELR